MKSEAVLHYACEVPQEFRNGTFVGPHLIELRTVNQLPGEIFGPVLHVIRFNKAEFHKVIEEINGTGFGLTLGVHSRIESFADDIVRHTRVGNNYINRNMVGAVVGVNPFGGQGLSGTGPKAGGPNYMTRFASEHMKLLEPPTEEDSPSDAQPGRSRLSAASLYAKVNADQMTKAMDMASKNQLSWDLAGGDRRAWLLDKAAMLLESRLPGQKSSAAVLHYYADQARQKCEAPVILPGPTGEIQRIEPAWPWRVLLRSSRRHTRPCLCAASRRGPGRRKCRAGLPGRRSGTAFRESDSGLAGCRNTR